MKGIRQAIDELKSGKKITSCSLKSKKKIEILNTGWSEKVIDS